MHIGGPYKNPARADSRKPWYLSYSVPKIGANGAPIMAGGRVQLVRHRPHYESRALAEADKPRIRAQHGVAGSGDFVHSRDAQEDYSPARQILPAGVTMRAAAEFFVRYNPTGETISLAEAREKFLAQREQLVGKTRHLQDLAWRTEAFVKKFPGRSAASIVRKEAIDYLLGLADEPRGKLNHKRALCTWGNWMLAEGYRKDNPFGGIKRGMLPKVLAKEVEFLSLTRAEAYLRCLERYDPDLVAHEIVQLLAGVRADDEMAGFRGEWVRAATKEVVTPAAITKTGVREVISGLEENFWAWWAAYGREGLLRPKNYKKRHWRIRILSAEPDLAEADRLAAMSIDGLLALPLAKQRLKDWPWNARRRTFCTYHVAKHQSADRTALILRQRATDATTLHTSYRGLGVTQAQGEAYFALLPEARMK